MEEGGRSLACSVVLWDKATHLLCFVEYVCVNLMHDAKDPTEMTKAIP